MDQEEDYGTLSVHYLENALGFVQAGEVSKAGELLWGSFAAALKALAAKRGIPLRTHRDVRRFAREVSRQAQEQGIWDDYLKAEHLHSNFYEALLEQEDLAATVESLQRRIQALLKMATLGG